MSAAQAMIHCIDTLQQLQVNGSVDTGSAIGKQTKFLGNHAER